MEEIFSKGAIGAGSNPFIISISLITILAITAIIAHSVSKNKY